MSVEEFKRVNGVRPFEPPTSAEVEAGREFAAPARVAGGRNARAAGAAHEASLDALHTLYRAQGRAFIRRRPHECRMVRGPDGKPRWIPAGPTGADYCGFLTQGDIPPRPMVVEAKTLATGNKRSLVLRNVHDWPQAERSELADAMKHGALALVIVDVRGDRYAGRWVVDLWPWRPSEMESGALTRMQLVDGETPFVGVRKCGPEGDYLADLGFGRAR